VVVQLAAKTRYARGKAVRLLPEAAQLACLT
jgi:hypothetical protein